MNVIKSLLSKPLGRLFCAALFTLSFTLCVRALAPGVAVAPDFSAGSPGAEVIVEIMPGETGSQIAAKLESAGVVKSALAFFRVAVGDERSGRIAAGEHKLESRIPAKEALNQLLDPKRIPNLIVIRDGERLNEISENLAMFGFTPRQLTVALNAVKAPEPFASKSLEGFLYPAHYSFNKGISAEEVIGSMVEKFSSATSDVSWQYRKFTPYELLTIASLVQTEGTPDVFGNVARVIYNRLEKGIALQFDSTVHYALNRRGEIRVSVEDTKVKSPYNTFLRQGLPPGPIGSPTRAAIDAALNPPLGDWLYFVTVKPRDTRFTSSYEQFLEWKTEYKKNFKAGLFG